MVDVVAPLAPTDGLTIETAERLLHQYGPNAIATERPPAWYTRLLLAFHAPFNYLLAAIVTVSAVTGEFRTAGVIGVMVVVSSLIRFIQENRSGRAAEKLRALVHTRATVMRSGQTADIPMADLVPGDVVLLSAGDLIPADLNLVAATDLFVSQATLTGESMPVEKHPPNDVPTGATGFPYRTPFILSARIVGGERGGPRGGHRDRRSHVSRACYALSERVASRWSKRMTAATQCHPASVSANRS